MSDPDGCGSPHTIKHTQKRQKFAQRNRRMQAARQGSSKPNSSFVTQRRLRNQSSKDENLAQDFSQLNLDHKISNETGISYDLRMTEHKCLWDENYPEKPERFSMPLRRCEDYGLIERCTFVPCRPANETELLTQHTSELIKTIEETKNESDGDKLERLSSQFDAIYFHPSTYELALLSVGGTIDLVEKVVNGSLRNGLALIRPPGHHAMKNEFCGYCYFNNVAVAAKHAVDNLGVKRVLIVDWDVHHGQASQYMFYDDPRVLYFSIHRYEHGDFWPNLRESNYDYIGEGAGKGYNFNVPLNKTGLGNAEYLAIFHQLLLPVAYEFTPDLVLISSGFDSAIGDIKGCMEVTPACYAHFVSSLMSLANGKVCVVLEGGYCIKSLSEGVALTLRALLGDPCPNLGPIGEPDASVAESILNVISVHRSVWKCLRYQGLFYEVEDERPADSKRKRHVPEIKFLGSTEKAVIYATRDCYPVQSQEEIKIFDNKIEELIRNTNLQVPDKRTLFAYDETMQSHKCYTEKSHPEKPDRLAVTYEMIKELKLLDQCHILPSRLATESEITSVHSKNYLDAMKDTESMEQKELNEYQESFQSIYLCKASYESAKLSVGCLLQILDDVVTEKARNGFALIRPPGHHAEIGTACGFCIFNNVAVAAKLATSKYGLERVLIVDWDVHHGNGIQHVFEDDPKVLYISLHRYDKGSFFPCSDDANYDKIGKDDGTGFNINIPWNKGGVGDGDYISAFLNVILPVAYQFDPQLVLVSAGFDAARGDPLGGCYLSPEVYGHLTYHLMLLANGRLILALEGGYNLSILASSVASCVRALLGEPCLKLSKHLHPCNSAVTSITNVISVLKKYWTCFKFQVDLPVLPLKEVSTNLDSEESCLLSNSTKDVAVCIYDTRGLITHFTELPLHSKMASGGSGPPGDGEEVNDLRPLSSQSTLGTFSVSKPQIVYAVTPLKMCPHLNTVASLPSTGFDIHAACKTCNDKNENWLCLTCFEVYCGRFINQDMLLHNQNTGHCVVMSFADLSVWCYGCEAYLDNSLLNPILEYAHMQKFGEDMPTVQMESINSMN